MKRNEKEIHDKLMEKFTPYNDYEVADYFGVSLTRIKKNGYYSIVLIYDYDKRALKSNSLVIPDVEKALRVYGILDKYAVNKKDQFDIDDIDLFGGDAPKDTKVEDVW